MQRALGRGSGSGGSSTGSMSTVSREDNLVLSSEDSSSPDETELELGLGLSLGGGGFRLLQQPSRPQFARILTAKDFPSPGSSSSSSSPSSSSASSSSSSPSSLSRADVTAGTKRSADSVAAANGVGNQVIGWPPIRAYRMNSMVHQAKSQATEELNSTVENKSKNCLVEKSGNDGYKSNCNAKIRTSLFVKVNMDGIPIGRKVDLKSHVCYETLAQTLEDMFLRSSTTANVIRSGTQEHKKLTKASKLLSGSSEFVLTYEDKEGDWMLVGDVPWGMFIGSVKRLRIMRTSEATGLDPSLQERNGRQRRS